MGKILFHTTGCIVSGCYRLLALTCVSFLLLFNCCKPKEPAVTILFTGDILLARNVKTELEEKKISPWYRIDSLFKSSDLVFGNFEGAVGGSLPDTMPASQSPVFNVPIQYVKLLADAGFSGLSVENNHSFDMGDSGKANTIRLLQNAGLAPLYYNNSPRFFKVKNVVIAVVAINLVPGRNGQRQQIPSIEIQQKLRLAKNLSNLVVVFIHWGSELLQWPDLNQRKAAEFLVQNGADLIIGCHPHVIQQPEMIEGRPVFFSVGNHLFDQKYDETKEGLIVDCKISGGYLTCSGIITHTIKNSFFPEVTGKTIYKLNDVKLHEPMQVSGYTLNPVSVNGGGLILQGYKHNTKQWQTYPMHILSLQQSKLDGKNDFLIALEKHYSNMDDETGIRPYVYSVAQNGLVSRWRGSALAWPLLDAQLLPDSNRILCALHRGDSFIELNPETKTTRVLAYQWNGFGFTGINDTAVCERCRTLLKK